MGKRGRKEAVSSRTCARVLWEELSKLRPHLAHWLLENTPGAPPGAPSSTLGLPSAPLPTQPPHCNLLLCALVSVAQTPITKGMKASPEMHLTTTSPEPWQLLPVTIPSAGQVLLKPRSKVCLLGLWRQRAARLLARPPITSCLVTSLGVSALTFLGSTAGRHLALCTLEPAPFPGHRSQPVLAEPVQGLLLRVGGRWPPGPHAVSPAPPATTQTHHWPQDLAPLSALLEPSLSLQLQPFTSGSHTSCLRPSGEP